MAAADNEKTMHSIIVQLRNDFFTVYSFLFDKYHDPFSIIVASGV